MANLQHAMLNLVMDEETAKYVAVLERKILILTIEGLKQRTALELLTDTPWDDMAYSDDEAELKKIATDALVRRVGMDPTEAATVVRERWDRYNTPPSEADEATKTYLVGPPRTKRPPLVTTAAVVDPSTVKASPGYDLNKHRQGMAISRSHMLKGKED